MNPSDQDSIVDACLDEVLGGIRPPDLTEQIVRAYRQRRHSADGSGSASPPAFEEFGATEPIVSKSASTVNAAISSRFAPDIVLRARPIRERRVPSATLILCVTLFLLISIVAAVVTVSRVSRGGWLLTGTAGQSFVGDSSSTTAELPAIGSAAATTGRSSDPGRRDPSRAASPNPAESDAPHADDAATGPSLVGPPGLDEKIPARRANAADPSPLAATSSDPPRDIGPRGSQVLLPPPLDDAAIVSQLNSLFRAHWTRHNVAAFPVASSDQWCNRLYRVLVGRAPSSAELEAFVQDDRKDKADRLLEKLLFDDPFAEEFARHWGQVWTDIFLDVDTTTGTGLVNREGLSQYFRRGIQDRKSFAMVASGLLTARGSGVPGDEDYDGAANFLLARAGEHHARATADVARLFLGRNMDCQQCHDDLRFDAGKQQQFWELNAFFRQLAARRPGSGGGSIRLVDSEPADDGRVFYSAPGGELKVAFPIFVDGTSLSLNDSASIASRREALARLIRQSAEFRRNIANRVWESIMGQAFVAPAQVVRHNKAVHPEPLVVLGDQFAAHGFDLRRLILWTVSCEPFRLADSTEVLSVASVETADPAEMPYFNQYYGEPASGRAGGGRPLLATLTEIGKQRIDKNNGTAAKVESIPSSTSRIATGLIETSPGIPSRLDVTRLAADPLVKVVMVTDRLSPQQKVEHLFLMAIHRSPLRREWEVIDRLLQQSPDRPQDVLLAIWVALHSG